MPTTPALDLERSAALVDDTILEQVHRLERLRFYRPNKRLSAGMDFADTATADQELQFHKEVRESDRRLDY